MCYVISSNKSELKVLLVKSNPRQNDKAEGVLFSVSLIFPALYLPFPSIILACQGWDAWNMDICKKGKPGTEGLSWVLVAGQQ